MATSIKGAFTSKLFTFVVGESKVPIVVHAGIIAAQSKALDALINGAMKEAIENKAELENVTQDTFERFCQFAYSGDYATPAVQELSENELAPSKGGNSDVEFDDLFEDTDSIKEEREFYPGTNEDGMYTQSNFRLKIAETLSARQKFLLRGRRYGLKIPEDLEAAKLYRSGLAKSDNMEDEDYTEIFLTHARLYFFAEYWGAEGLKTHCLRKLYTTLAVFELHVPRRPDIVKLLRFAFSPDHTPSQGTLVDELRLLVMLYCAWRAHSLLKCPEFESLVQECGPLALELVKIQQTYLQRKS